MFITRPSYLFFHFVLTVIPPFGLQMCMVDAFSVWLLSVVTRTRGVALKVNPATGRSGLVDK